MIELPFNTSSAPSFTQALQCIYLVWFINSQYTLHLSYHTSYVIHPLIPTCPPHHKIMCVYLLCIHLPPCVHSASEIIIMLVEFFKPSNYKIGTFRAPVTWVLCRSIVQINPCHAALQSHG